MKTEIVDAVEYQVKKWNWEGAKQTSCSDCDAQTNDNYCNIYQCIGQKRKDNTDVYFVSLTSN